MTIPGLYLIERLGRRVPLVIGGLWQAAWLLIFAIIGIVRPPVDYPSSGIVMIVSACMFIASFAATWGPFIWVGKSCVAILKHDKQLTSDSHWRDIPAPHACQTGFPRHFLQLAW